MDTIDIVRELIEENIPKGRYKTIVYGNPIGLVARRLLPALAIYTEGVQVKLGRTCSDLLSENLVIEQIISKRMVAKDKMQEVGGERLLRDWLFGIESTGYYKASSIYGILRSYSDFPDKDGAGQILTQNGFETEFFPIKPEYDTLGTITRVGIIREIKVNRE